MTHIYDPQNVFARILRGELPCKKVHENEHTLAFDDIRPQAPVHTLVICKGAYGNWSDFAARASDAEKVALIDAVAKVAQLRGVAESGYRVLANVGPDSRMEVPHLHLHVVGGEDLGPLRREPS